MALRHIDIDASFNRSQFAPASAESDLGPLLAARGWRYVDMGQGNPFLRFARQDGGDWDQALAEARLLVGALLVVASDTAPGR